MRRIAGLLTIVALVVSAAPAAAAPPGEGLITDDRFICDGNETSVTHSAGPSAWIGDQHYVAVSFSFTPTGEPADTKTFGHKSGLSGAVTCTQESPEGTFTVVALPIPPGG
jgi:hypothetical protein